MSSTHCRPERVRLSGRSSVARRETCRWSFKPELDERLYVGHADEHGLWTLRVGPDVLVRAFGPGAPRLIAAAMLGDAFPGRNIRPDLIDAFIAAWSPPDGGFVLPADLVIGWSLKWALDQPFDA